MKSRLAVSAFPAWSIARTRNLYSPSARRVELCELLLVHAPKSVPTLARVGARILWHSEAEQTVVGDTSDVYDEVIAVWYPSRAAFLELATDVEVGKVLHHRVAGLERAAIICCESGPEPVLTGVELGS